MARFVLIVWAILVPVAGGAAESEPEASPAAAILPLAIIALVVWSVKNRRKKQTEVALQLNEAPSLATAPRLISTDKQTGLAVNSTAQKVGVARKDGINVYDYKDIVEAAIVEDGEGLSETSRGSQVLGTAVGGALLGGAGAIVGGLSGKKRKTQEVREIKLRVVVNDTAAPVVSIKLFEGKTKKGSPEYKAAMEQAVEWHSLLSVLIRQAEKEDAITQNEASEPTSTPRQSATDELERLANLLERGLISREEFDAEKAKILN